MDRLVLRLVLDLDLVVLVVVVDVVVSSKQVGKDLVSKR